MNSKDDKTPELKSDPDRNPEQPQKTPSLSGAGDGLGTVLAAERRRKELSRLQVAESLNLSRAIIDDLEHGRAPGDIPSTYVRGYQRAYIRFLGLDETGLLGESATARVMPSKTSHSYYLGDPVSTQTKSGLFAGVLKLAAVVLFIAGVYFSWPGIAGFLGLVETQDNGSPVVVKPLDTVSRNNVDNKTPPASGADPQPVQPEVDENPAAARKIVIPDELDQSEFAQHKPDQFDVDQNTGEGDITPPAQAITPDREPSPADDAPVAEEDPVAEQSSPPGPSSITVVSNGETWLSITDAEGKRLYEGTLRLDRRTYEALLPLKITTGNLPDLRLILDQGEQQKVEIFGNNKAVAKFTVDKGEDGRLVFSPQ